MTNDLNNPEQEINLLPNPKEQKNDVIEKMREFTYLSNEFTKMVKNDEVNELCIGLYEEEILPPENPQKIKERLIGGCYRLDLEGNEYLVILVDGVIIKIKTSERPELEKSSKDSLANQRKISDKNLLYKIKKIQLII